MSGNRIVVDKQFYLQEDVVQIARQLLGKRLLSRIEGVVTGGIITETEAYAGITDKASHAYGNRRSARTEIMYRQGGCAYIYLIYGIHSLFNIVTNREGIPHAVLIRALHPDTGIGIMQQRLRKKSLNGLTDGPGKLSKALGLHYSLSGTDLTQKPEGEAVWLEHGVIPHPSRIKVGKRIGIDYAEEDALLPYRFTLDGTFSP
jgi:DNA-3-methyladenine glycosylase